jgi:hypothetical protein
MLGRSTTGKEKKGTKRKKKGCNSRVRYLLDCSVTRLSAGTNAALYGWCTLGI